MDGKQLIVYGKLAHGFFNLTMMALFCYQGWNGFLIRKARHERRPLPLDAVRRHRRAGPVFALGGILGFLAGAVLTVFDKGRILEYPAHFLGGSAIAVTIVTLFLLSRRIKGPESRYRDPHFAAGMLLLVFYIAQVLLGLAILL
jgi:hypothetical protein